MDREAWWFTVHGIFQARVLEWVAIAFSNPWSAAAKSLQSCPTLCNPIDGSPPGSAVPWDSPGKNTGVGWNLLELLNDILWQK